MDPLLLRYVNDLPLATQYCLLLYLKNHPRKLIGDLAYTEYLRWENPLDLRMSSKELSQMCTDYRTGNIQTDKLLSSVFNGGATLADTVETIELVIDLDAEFFSDPA